MCTCEKGAILKSLCQVGVSGLTVLVIGTMLPWLEAVLLARGATRVVTVDFAYKIRWDGRKYST